ncbi:dual specificity protein phosphatase 12 isoform X2 [Spea bombifrons]|uniref:dual specificity protein phosphatase 12 isoform X2 n=1 Tax=Spea bombifrons TaxID=233779 RepID=UPI002349F006|nr:dual specificity protein phosphatase 12 isoform X2 [Spea bombifrons]
MICVLPGLYIGSSSDTTDPQLLRRDGITHILTVDSETPKNVDSFHVKFVHVLDDSCADLLSCLPACLHFVKDALGTSGSAVLVHWINEEFVNQLALFEAMGCEVDLTSPTYKQYRLQKVTEKYPELKKLPQEIFASDPSSMGKTADIIYRCRKCRRSLFRESSILNHVLGTGPTAFVHKKLTSVCALDTTKCTSYFVEPVQWMEEALLGVMDGQLLCPKCKCKLGSFNWYGEQCSCGRWVTPAFQVHKNRVDEVKAVQIRGIQS